MEFAAFFQAPRSNRLPLRIYCLLMFDRICLRAALLVKAATEKKEKKEQGPANQEKTQLLSNEHCTLLMSLGNRELGIGQKKGFERRVSGFLGTQDQFWVLNHDF